MIGVSMPTDDGRTSIGVRAIAGALLVVHATMIGLAIPRNAVTVDEVAHLPAGISYWRHGRFWCYHHNPPLIRLLFAMPAVVGGVAVDERNYRYEPGSRVADWMLGRDFMFAHRDDYLRTFYPARGIVRLLSVAGGWLIFRWSSRIFGGPGGLVSLGLWTFWPDAIANAGLASCDLGATVVGLWATSRYWRYLRAPTAGRACVAGFLLGLAQASKFSMIALVPAWGMVGVANAWADRRVGRAAMHAVLMTLFALIALNDVYLFEGTGRPLGSFAFRSRTLTTVGDDGGRTNRFAGTTLGAIPMPLPEHYLLGFDDQAADVDGGTLSKYLRGEMRHGGDGWYGYYAYASLVKTPVGSMAIVGAAVVVGLWSRRRRADGLTEGLLIVVPALIFGMVSSQRGLNSHIRYVLPAVPYLCVGAGRLGRLAVESRRWRVGIVAAMGMSAASVVGVHPHYLAYFNEAAGGPGRGMEHLGESNIDWGQGLVALRDWLATHAPGRRIGLAYYGTMYPEILGIDHELPGFGPGGGAAVDGPGPGLQAVSVNFLLGFPFAAPNGKGWQSGVPADAYRYFSMFRPIAIVGHSIYIYDLSIDDADRARRSLGMAPYTAR